MKKHITKSYRQTQKLGENLAKEILRCKKNNTTKTLRSWDFCSVNKAVVLLLHGDLGGGKTTFLQGFAKGLGIKQKVLSPTFVIMKSFRIKSTTVDFVRNSVFTNFYHLDCYRLQNYKDAQELGLPEILKNPENIVAIEWPERIKKIIPKTAIKINLKFISENKRDVALDL